MLQKTRKGATSMIVIIFFTLLAGILVLSFVGVMLSNITQSTNYDLSQSAYDAALAGVEDAKVMLLEYNNCMSRGDNKSATCARVVNAVNAINSEENCDLVRDSLERPGKNENETLIRSDSSNISGVAAENLDMAYTCVLVSLSVSDYLGTIQNDSDMKVIPLRTHQATEDGGEIALANAVKVQWYSVSDYKREEDTYGADLFDNFATLPTSTLHSDNRQKTKTASQNQFKAQATLPPVLNVGIIQTAPQFMLSDFFLSNGAMANRGRLTLQPVNKGSNPDNRIANSASKGLAASTFAGLLLQKEQYSAAYYDTRSSINDNNVNSPYDVKCIPANELYEGTYACTAYIQLPDAYNASTFSGSTTGSTNDLTRFLTLSTPYTSPEISFSVTMLSCPTEFWTGDTDRCETVDFVGVQSKVDSTGRANDVFRRVDARVELVDTGYPFPKYAVGLHGDDNTELKKNYEATTNCWSIKNGSYIPCKDMEEVDASWADV